MIDWSKMRSPKDLQDEADAREAARLERELRELDIKSIRALRAVSAGVATQTDLDVLKDLDAQAAVLRTKLPRTKP